MNDVEHPQSAGPVQTLRPPSHPQPDRLQWRPIPPELPAEVGMCANCPLRRRSRVPGLVAVLLMLLALGLAVYFHKPLLAFLALIGRVGPGASDRDLLLGLSTYGIVLVSILAVLRIVLAHARNH